MYSRAYDRNRPTIPSGYNGTAFSEGAVTPVLPDADYRQNREERKKYPERHERVVDYDDRRPPERHEHGDHGDHEDRHHRPPSPPDEDCGCCDCLPAKIEPPCGKKPPLPSIFGGKLFPNGIGSEEILLLGLILLVSQNENDADVLIYLIILLFC